MSSEISNFNFNQADRDQLTHQNTKLKNDAHLTGYLTGQDTWVNLVSSEIKNGDVILDIGCGLGILDVILSRKFDQCHFYLLDRSEGARQDGHGGYNSNSDHFLTRTSLSLTRDFLIRNGVPIDRFTIIDVSQYDDLSEIPIPLNSVDVVLSKVSWCFHYPYVVYRDWCHQIMKSSSSKLLVDYRKGHCPVKKYRILNTAKKSETICIEYVNME